MKKLHGILKSIKTKGNTMKHLDSTKIQNEMNKLGADIRPFFKRPETHQNALAYLNALSFSPL